MRPLGIAAFWLLLAALVGPLAFGGPAQAAVARQEGTPAATPVPPPAETPPPPAETPAPTEAPAAGTATVTLVAWYAISGAGDFLEVFPLEANQEQFSGPEAGLGPVGRADFPEEGFPTIALNDSRFLSYGRFSGDEQPTRWTWFNDEEGNRPATLVLQVAGTEGTYRDWFGTATFVSRDEDTPNSGVLVLVLQPPDAGAEDAVPDAEATPAPAGAAPAPTEPPAEAGATAPPAEAAAPTEPAEVVNVATTEPAEAGAGAADPEETPES